VRLEAVEVVGVIRRIHPRTCGRRGLKTPRQLFLLSSAGYRICNNTIRCALASFKEREWVL
jgi:hypothetical protein